VVLELSKLSLVGEEQDISNRLSDDDDDDDEHFDG
jgi:hypothetical protein